MIDAATKESAMNHIRAWVFVIVLVMWPLAASAQTSSPYIGQEQRPIKALSDREIADLLEGRGMGLAKAAELNSYPGPLHVLQLADQLGLSEAQRSSSRALYERVREHAPTVGRQIIEAERILDEAFRTATIDPATLRSHLVAIATLQAQLRAIHLEAHLAQRLLLTAEQISRYDALRGYGIGAPDHNRHRHGG
jgi:Spy/CpxP family protein refolding chaperone